MRGLATAALACSLVVACGGHPSGATSAETAPHGGQVLAAGDAPRTLAALLRLRSPEQTLDRVTGWLGEARDWKRLLTADDPDMAAKLAFSETADIALGIDLDGGEPWGAMSVGIQPGVELSPSSGCQRIGPTRALCGESPEATAALGPFLAELATSPPAHDVEALLTRHGLTTLLQAPFEAGLNEGARAGSEPILRELIDGLISEAKLLLADVDNVQAHADVGDEGTGVKLAMRIELSSLRAWTWSSLVERGSRSGPAPEIFWTLPQDANTAFFWRGLSSERLAPIVDVGERFLVELLRDVGAPPQFSKQARELFALLAVLDATYASARGFDRKDFRVEVPTSPNAQTTREITIAMPLQWMVAVAEEDASRYRQLLHKSVALLQTPYLRKALKERFGEGSVPRVRLGPLGCTPRQAGTMATVDLPSSLIAALSDAPERALVDNIARQLARQGLMQFFVAVAEHQGRTWLVSAFDDKRLCSLLSGAVTPRPGLGSLRSELPLLSETPALLGGFTTLAAVLTSDSDVGSIQAVEALPFGGRTPIPFVVTGAPSDAGAVLRAELWFAEGAVRDLPTAVRALQELGN